MSASDTHDTKRKAGADEDVDSSPAKIQKTVQKKVTLNPYLYFNGNAREALHFYKDIFDGTIGMISTFENAPPPSPIAEDWKDKIMHASLTFDGCEIMFSDVPHKDKFHPGENVHLSVFIEDTERVQSTFQAMSEGGEVTMPLADQFWGHSFGSLKDKFGVQWMFSSNCMGKKDDASSATAEN